VHADASKIASLPMFKVKVAVARYFPSLPDWLRSALRSKHDQSNKGDGQWGNHGRNLRGNARRDN
jgi:hypothetical protein